MRHVLYLLVSRNNRNVGRLGWWFQTGAGSDPNQDLCFFEVGMSKINKLNRGILCNTVNYHSLKVEDISQDYRCLSLYFSVYTSVCLCAHAMYATIGSQKLAYLYYHNNYFTFSLIILSSIYMFYTSRVNPPNRECVVKRSYTNV